MSARREETLPGVICSALRAEFPDRLDGYDDAWLDAYIRTELSDVSRAGISTSTAKLAYLKFTVRYGWLVLREPRNVWMLETLCDAYTGSPLQRVERLVAEYEYRLHAMARERSALEAYCFPPKACK